MSRGNDDSDSDDSAACGAFRPRRPREILEAQGYNPWGRYACVGLTCVISVAAISIGFLSYRSFILSKTAHQGIGILGTERVGADEQQSTTPFPPVFDSQENTLWQQLGCFKMIGSDSTVTPVLMDTTCATIPSDGLRCRSGLPFYRMTLGGAVGMTMDWKFCADFCLLKGFHVAGVIDSTECRCGAIESQRNLWAMAGDTDRSYLHWQPPWDKVEENDPSCRIVAIQYKGKTSQSFSGTSQDLAYIGSIMRAAPMQSLEQQELYRQIFTTQPPTMLSEKGLADPGPAVQQDWLRSESLLRGGASQKAELLPTCYPNRCAWGWPWPIWSSLSTSGIPFAFADSTDATMKKIFRQAIDKLSQVSCVRFNEVSVYYNTTYKILVKGNEKMCGSSDIGYPAGNSRKDLEINLGWCRTQREMGSMVHEVLHALGMGHEQTRSDRGKYVQVHWENIPTKAMRFQYQANPDSYVGSEGGGNLAYDYDSIMHYPATSAMNTLPLVGSKGAHDSQIGQRQHLSSGDVLQLRNMYACDRDTALPCQDMDDGLAAQFKLASGKKMTCPLAKHYCKNSAFSKDVLYFCPVTCGTCPMTAPVPAEVNQGEKVEGCEDMNEDLCWLMRDYCPGKISGQEQWMSGHCRKTCWIESFCGPAPKTTPGPTTPRPTLQPPSSDAMDFKFAIDGEGYDLSKKEDQQVLQDSISANFKKIFGTEAAADIQGTTPASMKASVKLQCGCNPYANLPCSISCADLKVAMMKFTIAGSKELNEQFVSGGLSGLKVKNTFMHKTSDRLVAVFMDPTVLLVTIIVAVMCTTLGVVGIVYYKCIHSDANEDGATESLLHS